MASAFYKAEMAVPSGEQLEGLALLVGMVLLGA